MLIQRDEDQATAMADIAPLLPGLHELLHDAFAFYNGPDYSERARAEHNDRATANNINIHAERRMIERFSGMPGVAFINIRGLHVLNYRDKVVVRLKKVMGNGRHRNVQTEQQLDYDDQLPIVGLPNPARRLTAGYQPDAAGLSIERVMIARPVGRTIFWTSQVNVDRSAQAQWTDITPQRLGVADAIDFDAERARLRRGRRR